MIIVKKLLNKMHTIYLHRCFLTIELQQGVVIDHRCEIEQKNNIRIGKKSILYKNITIYKQKEGQLNIGAFSHIAPYGYFLVEKQNLTIGDHVAMGPFCSVFCSTNTVSNDKEILFKDRYDKGDVQIGNNVLIGAHCVILPNTVIGDDVVIAANSTVKGQLESGHVYGGNPAQKIKALGNEQKTFSDR